jgi:chemotaxis protein methyltransferase CheR
MPEPLMSPQDLDFVRALVRARSGISLGDDKAYLLESRLMPLTRQLGFEKVGDMLAVARRAGAEALAAEITEALTTNETSFFRDGHSFEQIGERVLPEIVKARTQRRRLRIWSAACSTGQEAYSLAMLIEERLHGLHGWSVEILATDLAERALARVREATYSEFEVRRGLVGGRLARWFTSEAGGWRVRPEIARRVTARRHNLLEDDPGLGSFDLVLLRNVLLYFDVPTKQAVLARIRRHLAPDGCLMLGGTETIVGVDSAFAPIPGCRGLFRPDEARFATAGQAPLMAGGLA